MTRGGQALGLGLVDEVGGLPEARAAAVRLLDLALDAPVEFRRYPVRRSPLQQLLDLFDQRWVETFGTIAAWREALKGPGSAETLLPRIR